VHSKYGFSWRAGNRFELLVDGQVFLSRMLGAIQQARCFVLMESYLFESGAVANRFIDTLAQAAQRGVAVKLLIDGFGALRLKAIDQRRLRRSGVDVVVYNVLHFGKQLRNLLRDHRKLLLIDGSQAYTGGAGITDAFDPAWHRPWRETMLAIEGPVVADWQELFARTWSDAAGQALVLPATTPAALADGQAGEQNNGRCGQWGRVVASSGVRARNDITRSVVSRVSRAEHRVWLASAYFVPSRKLRHELRQAARRGVDVRLLLPGPDTDHPSARYAGRRFFARLLANGVHICEYQPRFMHAKVVLCDDWASVGSSNLDHWNLRWNLEANQEVHDARTAGEIAAMFEEDFRHSEELDYGGWQQRWWGARALENLWGTVDAWLKRLRHFDEVRAARRQHRSRR
jgi:phosphatidylserine/phosphatidylglycerophosphate/cardiolipin synthase-like enzyme